MSRFRTLFLASAALVFAACSDSPSPSAPSDGDELTLQLDESSAAAVTEEGTGSEEATGAKLGSGGRGKRKGVNAEAVLCVDSRWHALCLDVRNGVLRSAAADAIVKTSNRSTRGQLRLNGFLIEVTNRFGPNFRGDEIFATYPGIGIRVFRNDRICHQFPGATPQICGVIR